LKGKAKAQSYKAGADVSITGLKQAIAEALFEADTDTFKGCIAILIEKMGYSEITKVTGLTKSTLYRMCEPTSNPTLENVGKVLSYINDLASSSAA